MNAAEIAASLGDATREGRNWRCRCPVHNGVSLTLADGRDQLLILCWGGCESRAVLAELRRRGLLADDRPPAPSPAPALAPSPAVAEHQGDPERWRRPWRAARPIARTLAETYLEARGLRFDDRDGRVLRFAPRRARLGPGGELEHHPALLAALCDVRTGEQTGFINVYLAVDGRDRLRDRKGKTVTGRARDAAIMLSGFDEVTMGIVVCEGVETGIALHQQEVWPLWALGGAGNLAKFPALAGIEGLTIFADADLAGQQAAKALEQRWEDAGRTVLRVAPPAGDWADL